MKMQAGEICPLSKKTKNKHKTKKHKDIMVKSKSHTVKKIASRLDMRLRLSLSLVMDYIVKTM